MNKWAIWFHLLSLVAVCSWSLRSLRSLRSLTTLSGGTVERLSKLFAAPPHGGKLVSTMVDNCERTNDLVSTCDMEIELDERQLCDVELLMQGGFSPLDGFMDEGNYHSVLHEMKLLSGENLDFPWSMTPIVIPSHQVSGYC